MLLKLLLALAPMLLLNDAGAAAGEGGEGEGQPAGEGNTSSGNAGQSPEGDNGTTEKPGNSLNSQIREFAKERGITVEELMSRYDELDSASKTEFEKITGERDRFKGETERLMTELRNLRSESAFLEAAREARARAPKTLYRAFRDQLDYDKQGNPTNIADVIAAARDEEPDLFLAATGTSDAGRRGDGDGQSRDINAVLREMAGQQR